MTPEGPLGPARSSAPSSASVAGSSPPGDPASPSSNPSNPSSSPSPPSSPDSPGTILIIDPDPDILQSTGMLIESMGYQVLQLAEPDDILEAVDREQPDLVLLEVKMRDLNVAGLLASLRSSPRTSRIPIAFFSASFELGSIAARHQAWGYLAKPFGYHELSHLLERALGPPPGKLAAQDPKVVEKEVRTAFREYRNLLGALNNYVMVLSKFEELDPHAKSAVARVEDLVLMLEARTERLRSYILALLGPIEPTPRGPRPSRRDDEHPGVRTGKRRAGEPEGAAGPQRASTPPARTLEERRQAAREAMLRGR